MINTIELEQGVIIHTDEKTAYIKSFMKNEAIYRAKKTSENEGDNVLYAILLNGEASIIKVL